MLDSWKKIRALRDQNKNILTLVLSEKNILNETKNHNPRLQVKWSVTNIFFCKSSYCVQTFVRSFIIFNNLCVVSVCNESCFFIFLLFVS